MSEFYINNETCSRCGTCVEVCSSLILEKEISGMINFNAGSTNMCVGCGHCMAVCNTKSVFAHGMKYEKDFQNPMIFFHC